MRIAVGSDHRGYELKKLLMARLVEEGHTCQDFGAFSTESVDYPDTAAPVAQAVARGDFDRGVLICDTGIGMSIAANKVAGIRAALCYHASYARRARQHNDANVLCLGSQNGTEANLEVLAAFLTTGFEGGRHQRRLDKIASLEC